MKNNTRCFILCRNGYEKITYSALRERMETDPAYSDKRFILLHGMLMEVTEADYLDFYKIKRRRKYIAEEEERNGAFSYHALDSRDVSGESIVADDSPPFDDQVADKLRIEEMLCCFGRLNDTDHRLLTALYFDGKSERELSRNLDIPRKTLSYRKNKAIERFRRLMKF